VTAFCPSLTVKSGAVLPMAAGSEVRHEASAKTIATSSETISRKPGFFVQ